MIYAGIGSRETPPDILDVMEWLGALMQRHGWHLRSGGARGADQAFARLVHDNHKVVFRPHHATPEAIEHASKFHPAWNRCSDIAKQLHGRNSMIMLGAHLNHPVNYVICWTPDGKDSGGTGLAIRIATAHGIPVWNLHDQHTLTTIKGWLK